MAFEFKKARVYPIYAGIQEIAGWLNPVTGKRSIDILNWQAEQGIEGDLFEIGVFCGKYFAILLDNALRHGSHVLGVDTFEFSDQARVHSEMTGLFGQDVSAHYTLWQKPSSALSEAEVIERIGRPRFISIDGAHDVDNVYRDLTLCERLISADGVIAVDDFLNPLTLGVNQAVNLFLSTPRAVVPVAYIANKLFLAHAARAEDYRAAFEAAIASGAEPPSENFRKMRKKGRAHVEQPLFGHKVILS